MSRRLLCRVATEAPSLRLNSGVLLLPMRKALNGAEQLGALDIMATFPIWANHGVMGKVLLAP